MNTYIIVVVLTHDYEYDGNDNTFNQENDSHINNDNDNHDDNNINKGTNTHKIRTGIRYMSNGLKVYYLPFKPLHLSSIPFTFYTTFPLVRQILIREDIHIVHGHQSASMLVHETFMHAKTCGYKVSVCRGV